MVRSRWLRLVAVTMVTMVTAVACGGPERPGSVGGMLPACYGPGPDMNLTPTRVVEVYRDGDLVKSQSFRSDSEHQTYEIDLPPGRYDVKGPGIASIPVRVKSGKHVTLDLPVPPCA